MLEVTIYEPIEEIFGVREFAICAAEPEFVGGHGDLRRRAYVCSHRKVAAKPQPK